MPRFFIRQEQIENDVLYIRGDDARHIARSLRMAVGEAVTVCDMQGIEYECTLDAITDEEVRAIINSSKASENEPLCFVRLFQALPKGDKLDTVIQKAVECGVGEIIPFESERCIVRIKADAEDKKRVRRQRIAEEAAKQCGRSVIPEVKSSVSFAQMLDLSSKSDITLFCYEGEGTEPLGKMLKNIAQMNKEKKGISISVIIGSEGGFSLCEAEQAKNAGFSLIGLGKRILRTETAPVFVLSSLVCFTELM